MSEYTGEVLTERPKIAPAGSTPPIGMAAVPAIEKEFKDEYDAKKATLRKDYEQKKEEITTTSPFTIPGLLTSPPALVTGGALLGAATLYAAPKIYKSVKERFMASPVQTPVRIDPIGFESFADMTPTPTTAPAPNPLGQTNLTPEDIQARAAQLKAPVAPGATPTIAELDAAFAAQQPISTPITAAPVDAPAPTPSAAPNSPVTSIVTDTVKEMIQETPDQPIEAAKPPAAAPAPVAPPQELRTGTGKPAFAGMGPEAAVNKKGEPKFKPDYGSINDVPSGYAFVPNAQYIDTPRQNIGLQEYLKAYTERPFPLTNEQAIQESKDINRLLGRATRAEAKAAGLAPAEITPGITKKTSAGTKPVRVAGTVGALVAIPDLAKAETPGQRGLAGASLLEAVLPPGFMMGGAGQGSDIIPNADAAMLLGSPYAQTELAKKRRQALEYAAKVGGGRGLTPASAYQR